MSVPWEQIWEELKDSLNNQPRCTIHPQYRRITTLEQPSTNDILKVDEEGVSVQSHHPKKVRLGKDNRPILKKRLITVEVLRIWWEHLQEHGTATFSKESSNRPDTADSSVVAAILARCLPNRIAHSEKGQIRIKCIDANETDTRSVP